MSHENNAINKIPPEILKNLNMYTGTRQCTCLKCGYIGLMGVVKELIPWYASIPFALILAWGLGIVMSLFWAPWIVGLAVAIIVWGIRYNTAKVILCCPSCEIRLNCKLY